MMHHPLKPGIKVTYIKDPFTGFKLTLAGTHTVSLFSLSTPQVSEQEHDHIAQLK